MRYRGYNISIMSENDIFNVNTDERLATLRFICNNKSHISIDVEKCKNCKNKECTFFCPADVYTYDKEANLINADFENCLECGTCRLSCPNGAIKWEYPRDSQGPTYKFG